MSKLLPTYLFLCSMAFLLLYRYLFDFIVLSSFYFLLAICLFSLLCSLFVTKMLGWHWLQIIMLWSGGTVNLQIRFWPTLCYIFDLIFRVECLSFLWLDLCGLSSFERGRWELSNDAKTAWIRCLNVELLRLKILEKNMK